jgi:hypothetical protein
MTVNVRAFKANEQASGPYGSGISRDIGYYLVKRPHGFCLRQYHQ